jgi:hypothetical protein
MGGSRSPAAIGPTMVGLILVAAVALGACGADGTAERPYEPTLPTIDARPRLVLAPGDDTMQVRAGERSDPALRVDPPTVPSGSVVEVRNDGTRDHRWRAGAAFDTGIMRPGERTTVVVTNPATAPVELDVVDVDAGASRGHLTVLPAPST